MQITSQATPGLNVAIQPDGTTAFIFNSSTLDAAFGTVSGSVLARGPNSWVAVAPSTPGYILQSNGNSAPPSWATPASIVNSTALDLAFGTTRGGLLSRGASGWGTIVPSNAGYHLQDNGPGADPTYSGFLQSGTGAVSRTWQDKNRDLASVKDFGAKGDGVTNDAPAINLAMALGKKVYFPSGTYLCNSAINLQPGSGIIGDGEATNIKRNFTGGRLIGYSGGAPIYLRDFQVSSAVTAVSGDTGIDIGYASAWQQRGEIANILIQAQWDGFKWAGGTQGPITNIQCISNLNHGFLSQGGRGQLYGCLSQYNAGNGYYFVAQAGQTGVQILNCGTFANNGWGFLFDAAPAVTGANIWMSGCSSSYDGGGGIGYSKQYSQIWMSDILVEQSGNAHAFVSSFALQPLAQGLFISTSCQQITLNNIYIQNTQGNGCVLDTISRVSASNIIILTSGQSASGAANQIGLSLNSNVTDFTLQGLIANTGATQTTDISIGAGCVAQFVNPNFRTYSNGGGGSIQFNGVQTTATRTIASAATIVLYDYIDNFSITGITTITTISAASAYAGRRITLIFTGSLTVSNAGNIKLSANFSATPTNPLTLVTDGSNWYQG